MKIPCAGEGKKYDMSQFWSDPQGDLVHMTAQPHYAATGQPVNITIPNLYLLRMNDLKLLHQRAAALPSEALEDLLRYADTLTQDGGSTEEKRSDDERPKRSAKQSKQPKQSKPTGESKPTGQSKSTRQPKRVAGHSTGESKPTKSTKSTKPKRGQSATGK